MFVGSCSLRPRPRAWNRPPPSPGTTGGLTCVSPAVRCKICTMRRICAILATAYVVGGIGVWIEFTRTNPDGLANVGLILYVFPISLSVFGISYLTGRAEFFLLPDRFGYFLDHAIFFFPSLFLIGAVIAMAPPKIVKWWNGRRRNSRR